MLHIYNSTVTPSHKKNKTIDLFQRKRSTLVILSFILLLSSISTTSQAQPSIVKIIDKTESATFSVYAYNKAGISIDTARAFFISNGGLALTSASIFENADTITISDHKNKQLYLSRIIAIHPFANLAMIQIANFRNNEDQFINPSRTPFNASNEVMTFPHESDNNNSLNISKIQKIIQPFVLNRSAILSLPGSKASRSAPIINTNGELVGILHYIKSTSESVMLPIYLLNSNQWVSVSKSWTKFKSNTNDNAWTTVLCTDALLLQSQGKWVESARLFTQAFKKIKKDPYILALRSISRYNYNNVTGANEDFNRVTELDNNCGLAYYGRAIYHLKNQEYQTAKNDLLICLQKEDLPKGFVLLGQLQSSDNEIKKAYASFTYATELDSLYAEAWYERGRLTMQYASNHNPALNDLTKAAQLNPYLPGVYTLIGNIKFNRNNYLEAIKEFDRALRMDPNDDHALMNRGMSYFNTGLKKSACKDWEHAGKLGNTQVFRLISKHCSQLKHSRY